MILGLARTIKDEVGASYNAKKYGSAQKPHSDGGLSNELTERALNGQS